MNLNKIFKEDIEESIGVSVLSMLIACIFIFTIAFIPFLRITYGFFSIDPLELIFSFPIIGTITFVFYILLCTLIDFKIKNWKRRKMVLLKVGIWFILFFFLYYLVSEGYLNILFKFLLSFGELLFTLWNLIF